MISLTADQLDQIIGGGLRRYGIAPRIVLRTASVATWVASWLITTCAPVDRSPP